MNDDNKQVQLTDEMVEALEHLREYRYPDERPRMQATYESLGAMDLISGTMYYDYVQDMDRIMREVTPAGIAALQSHKAKQPPPEPSSPYHRHEPEAGHGIDMELAAHMYMAAAWYYGGIEHHDGDEVDKCEIQRQIKDAIKAYKTKAGHGIDKGEYALAFATHMFWAGVMTDPGSNALWLSDEKIVELITDAIEAFKAKKQAEGSDNE